MTLGTEQWTLPYTEEQARALVQSLLDQLRAARCEVEAAERRARGLQKMVDGLRFMFPALNEQGPG